MIIDTLHLFYITATTGSFLKASEQLFLSSTALTKQINQLERTVGARLFNRTNKGLELTEAGKRFLVDAEDILRRYHNALNTVREIDSHPVIPIRIGVSQINPYHNVNHIFENEIAHMDRFFVSIVPISSTYKDFTEHLRTLGSDVDVIPYVCGYHGLDCVCRAHCLARLPVRIAVPVYHPLAKKSRLTYDDLNGQTLVTISSVANTYYAGINDAVRRLAPGVALHSVNHYDYMLFNHIVRSSHLILVGDHLHNIHPQLKVLPVDWDLTLPYGLLYAHSPSEAVSSLIQGFIDCGLGGDPETTPVVELCP